MRDLHVVMLPREDAETPEALRRLRLVQKQLRALRREIGLQAREVSAHFRAEGLKLLDAGTARDPAGRAGLADRPAADASAPAARPAVAAAPASLDHHR